MVIHSRVFPLPNFDLAVFRGAECLHVNLKIFLFMANWISIIIEIGWNLQLGFDRMVIHAICLPVFNITTLFCIFSNYIMLWQRRNFLLVFLLDVLKAFNIWITSISFSLFLYSVSNFEKNAIILNIISMTLKKDYFPFSMYITHRFF